MDKVQKHNSFNRQQWLCNLNATYIQFKGSYSNAGGGSWTGQTYEVLAADVTGE
jgi:hypothetical protein